MIESDTKHTKNMRGKHCHDSNCFLCSACTRSPSAPGTLQCLATLPKPLCAIEYCVLNMILCLRIRNSRSAYHSTNISPYHYKSQMFHEKKIDQTKGPICRLPARDSALRYYTKPRRRLLSRSGHSWLALIHAWVRQLQTASPWPYVGLARTPCSLRVQRFNPEESLCSCTPMIPARRASTLRPNTTDSAG